MPGTPTARYSIPTLAGTTLVRAIDTEVNDGLNAIDAVMAGYSEGTLASRPVSTPGTPGIAGREYFATDTGQRFKDTGTGWYELDGAGDLKATIRATAPDGWLLCDGQAVSRATYAALYAALGGASSPYGHGDGTTTFNVPNLKGRVLVHRDADETKFNPIGNRGGSITHRLTGRESGVNGSGSTVIQPNHVHGANDGHAGIVQSGGGGPTAGIVTGSLGYTLSITGGAGAHSHMLAEQGATDAHPNLQPYQVVNWLVKT